MCAFTACVRFLRRRGPAGLRSLFFDYSVVIFALSHGLAQTWKQLSKTGRAQCPPQIRQKRFEVLLWCWECSPPLKNRTQRLTGANKSDFYAVVSQDDTVFGENTDFEDALRAAVSLVGDSDTLAAITGSIAETFYGVPEELRQECYKRLPPELTEILHEWEGALYNEEKYGRINNIG